MTGTVIYKDKPQQDLRVIPPIKTIADLKGKRIPTGYASQRVLDVPPSAWPA